MQQVTVHVLMFLMYASNKLKTWQVNVYMLVLLVYVSNKLTLASDMLNNLNLNAFLHVLH